MLSFKEEKRKARLGIEPGTPELQKGALPHRPKSRRVRCHYTTQPVCKWRNHQLQQTILRAEETSTYLGRAPNAMQIRFILRPSVEVEQKRRKRDGEFPVATFGGWYQ